ncbi:MAG: hypothetical protein E7498_07110 [Ruminococcus sp.]|nr:hypothetical protein [Ruminococcus sp.]
MKMNKEVCIFMNTISYIMRSDGYYLLHVSKKDDVNRHKILAGYYDDKYVYFIPSVVIAVNDMVSFAEKERKVNMQRVLRQLARGRFIKSTKHKSGEVRYRLEKRIGKTRYRYITFHKNIFLIWIAKEMLGWV